MDYTPGRNIAKLNGLRRNDATGADTVEVFKNGFKVLKNQMPLGILINLAYPLINGDRITISYDVSYEDPDGDTWGFQTDSQALTFSEGHNSQSITLRAISTDKLTTMTIGARSNMNSDNLPTVSNIMIERGNEEHDFKYAPEDYISISEGGGCLSTDRITM